MLVVRLLGQFSVRLDDAPVEIPLRSAQSLLAYLLVTAGTTHRREKLAGLFWPNATEAGARQSLRQALWQLRRAFGPREQDFLLADSASLGFNPAAGCWLDAAALQQPAAPDASTEALIEAVSAYGGELLPGFYDDWVALEREHLAAAFERQMQRLLERLEAERAWPALAAWAENWLAFGQVPEPAYRALMLARAVLGDLAGMAAAYQRCAADLQRELGVEPSPQTKALFEQLRQGRLPAEAPAPPPAGLEARYELREEVGRGGMGVVHRAHDRLLERDVAVKLLSHTGLGTTGRARLLREAQAAARLQHPHIVAVFDAGDFNGTPAIVMELVAGPTLDRRPTPDMGAVLRVGAAVAAALEHAHAHGVLHRDVKPGNVVLGADGSAKLMDFGLAYSAANSHLTQAELPGGTALYMATEVLRGEPATAQSDLYALGATLYELAAGRPPFAGDDLPSVIGQHLHAPLVPPSAYQPALPAALDDLIVRLLAKAPADRPASAAEARQVLERLARGEAVEVEAPAPGEPPYRGLQAFDEADAGWFFGREQLVAQLVSRLRATRLLVVVIGASGSGKSSVVRAGLVAALRRGEPLADGSLPPAGSAAWPIHVLTPTARPLEALAERLTAGSPSVQATLTLLDDLASDPRSLHTFVRRRLAERQPPAERLLLVVDQFEELFTLCRDDDERRAFVDNLLYAASPAAAGPTVVVLTLRADFYAHCAAYPNLRDALARHQEYIGPMSPAELRRAIEAPAARGGWALEGGLVELLLKDVGDEPGALPLLSHALLETWQRRRGRTLTLRGYTEAGGVRGAIAQTAEAVYSQLAPAQQVIARNLFLRLTELGEGTQDTRRRASRAELVPHPEDLPAVDEVLHLLSQARLITAGQDTVEVAHEALIREWPTLRQWLSENRDGLRLHRHLTQAAAEWQRRHRDPAELYRGARLAQAVEWAQFSGRADDLNALEREFLAASQAAAEHEAAERDAQRQRELEAAQQLAQAARRETAFAHREAATAQQLTATEQRRSREQARANRQLRRLAAGLAVLLLFSFVAGGLALTQSQRAQREAHVARAREWAAEAVNQLTVDPERSIWLALYALEEGKALGQGPLGKVEETLHRAVQADRLEFTLPHDDIAIRVAFSPDGQRLITIDTQAVVRVWDLTVADPVSQQPYTLALPEPFTSLATGTMPVALNAQGTQVAVATASGDDIVIVDIGSGEVVHTLHETSLIQALAFSPDGQQLAVATGTDLTATDSLRLWDLKAGERLALLSANSGSEIAYSPDGTHVVVANRTQTTASVVDLATGKGVFSLTGHLSGINSVAFSASGRYLATASYDSSVRLWDAESGEPHGNAYEFPYVSEIAFSPDEQQIAVALVSGNIRILDVASSQVRFSLDKHSNWITDVAYSPDGTRLVTASADRTVKVWSTTGTLEWMSLVPPDTEGATAIAGESINALAYSAPAAGTPPQLVAALSWSARLNYGVSVYRYRLLAWDAATGKLSATVDDDIPINRLVTSRDGRQLAGTAYDGYVRIWDAQTWHMIRAFSMASRANQLTGVAFDPSGERVAAANCYGELNIWDIATQKTELVIKTNDVQDICGLGGWMPILFSAEGRLLIVGGPDKHTRIYDAHTGELKQTLAGQKERIYSLAISPDGRLLATGSDGSTIILWDIASASPRYTLIGHSQGISGLDFAPDGRVLASSSWDGLVKLWDVQSGQERLSLFGPGGDINALAFSSDGRYLAAGGASLSIQIYLARLDDLVSFAVSRLSRTLTTDECQQYLRLDECPPLPGDLAASVTR